jgi:hypothetical protein
MNMPASFAGKRPLLVFDGVRAFPEIYFNPFHAQLWGTEVTTPIVKSNYANVNVISTIVHQLGMAEDDISVEHSILSPSGIPSVTSETKDNMESGASKAFESTLVLSYPQQSKPLPFCFL